MNWTYDASVRALYVEFSTVQSDRQVELWPGVVADLDPSGGLVGLEVLDWRSLDVDAIADRFHLDVATAAVLKEIVYQPLTGMIGYRSPSDQPKAQDERTSYVEPVEASASHASSTPQEAVVHAA